MAVPRLVLALLISALCGVLVAGLALPVIGGIGLAAKAGSDDFLSLPAELNTPALATRSTVLASDGSLLATFYRVNRVEAPLASIPATMRQAIVAIEDSRFYEHHGVDFKGTLRAAVTNFTSDRVAQGGSTLTQQYVKNALLEASYGDKAAQDAAVEKSAERKLSEARYALAIERELPKDEILHRYLDIAYFGNGVYGIGTAATYYFNKPVDQLTLDESALLAGVVQNPTYYDVDTKDETVRAALVSRRNTVLGRMRDLGYITEETRAATAAIALPVVTPSTVGQDCGAAGVAYPFFCDYVRRELTDTDVGRALGATPDERRTRLFAGGLTITTSIDPRIQAAAQAAVDAQVPNGDPSGVATASDIVQPGNGYIRAMAEDRPYGDDPGQTHINVGTGGSYGFQPGSTFKAFFLASALQQGIPLSTTFDSPAKYTSRKNGCATADSGRPFEVSNAGDSEAGVFDMRTGTHLSVNTYYAQLAELTGLEKPLALAEAMGIKELSPDGEKPLPRVCTAYLGSATVSPLAMTAAYAAFAAHGLYCAPRAVMSITAPGGTPVEVPPPACSQVLEPGVADTVTSVLTGVISGGGTGSGASIGRPAAGKTGTTNSSRAAWFVGYTPQLATGVWVGHFPDPLPMTRIRINRRTYSQVYGGTLPAAIWRQTMTEAMAPLERKGFTPADPTVVRGGGQNGTVPDVSGLSYNAAVQALTDAGYVPAAGKRVASRLRVDRVVYTSPRAGRAAEPGTKVFIYRSSGPAPRPSPTTAAPPPTVPPAVPPPVPPAAPAPTG